VVDEVFDATAQTGADSSQLVAKNIQFSTQHSALSSRKQQHDIVYTAIHSEDKIQHKKFTPHLVQQPTADNSPELCWSFLPRDAL